MADGEWTDERIRSLAWKAHSRGCRYDYCAGLTSCLPSIVRAAVEEAKREEREACVEACTSHGYIDVKVDR